MQVDKTTLTDLNIFHHHEEQSVFHYLNFTGTIGGREYFKFMLSNPFSDVGKIRETQRLLQLMLTHLHQWPTIISNGTIMVIEKYFETPVNDIPRQPNAFTALSYRLLSAADFSLTRYSVKHFLDFASGVQQIVALFANDEQPPMLSVILQRVQVLVNKPIIQQFTVPGIPKNLTRAEVLQIAHFLRYQYKAETLELIGLFSRMDAYHGMATCCRQLGLVFPNVHHTHDPYVQAEGLYHLLLPTPVAYDITLNDNQNFLFLTGANMAGKSTFIKALGVAVYLAHVGMGVPARQFSLSLFDGLLSNIQVEDNILKGESYFFSEVKRVRKTIEKINDGRHWLILIDELFKGTNVQDAMKCSTIVIEGLRKLKNALFVLSTHLYEIGDDLKQFSNIKFSYFETHIVDGQLIFSYQLKDGISNDRLGYLILKREGVVHMLENL